MSIEDDLLQQFETEMETPVQVKRAYDPRFPTHADFVKHPERFCDKTKLGWVLVKPRLAKIIADSVKMTRGPGGGLWYDAGGYFVSGGENLVNMAVQEILGEDFTRYILTEVMAWSKALPVEITTNPGPENLLNLANGVLDLDTLTLRPVLPTERFTYQIPITWNPNATCPETEKFVRQVVPLDCVGLVSEILGMCLLPTGRYRRAVMLLGPGANGKSVMLKVIRALLGVDNVRSVTLQALSEERFAKAQLFGKLANIAGDLDSRPIERSGAFKMLTGEDPITADHKYGQPFQYVNYASLVFSANEWPVSYDQTNAYFTRWIPIPFRQIFVEGDAELKPGELRADPLIGDKLTTREELQGLLVQAVHGARRLRERGGFNVPDSSREAIAEYREWADTVLAWIVEHVAPAPGARFSRSMVYDSYRRWCQDNGRSSVSTKKFWPRFREALAERGVQVDEVMVTGTRMVDGVTMNR